MMRRTRGGQPSPSSPGRCAWWRTAPSPSPRGPPTPTAPSWRCPVRPGTTPTRRAGACSPCPTSWRPATTRSHGRGRPGAAAVGLARPGAIIGGVGVPHDVTIDLMGLFRRSTGPRGGPGLGDDLRPGDPARRRALRGDRPGPRGHRPSPTSATSGTPTRPWTSAGRSSRCCGRAAPEWWTAPLTARPAGRVASPMKGSSSHSGPHGPEMRRHTGGRSRPAHRFADARPASWPRRPCPRRHRPSRAAE